MGDGNSNTEVGEVQRICDLRFADDGVMLGEVCGSIADPFRRVTSFATCTIFPTILGEAPRTLSPELVLRDEKGAPTKFQDTSHAEAATGADFSACDRSVRL